MSGGTVAGRAAHTGFTPKIAAMVSENVSPKNASCPESISYNTQPNAQTSVRVSRRWPRACSGLMYAGVPTSPPYAVAFLPVAARDGWASPPQITFARDAQSPRQSDSAGAAGTYNVS